MHQICIRIASMASKCIKRGNKWFQQVRRNNISKSASFNTKAQAVAWGVATEAEIIAGKLGQLPNKTFKDLLDRYLEQVSSTKRGEKWESIRINNTINLPIAKVKVAELDATHVAEWRDARLKVVSNATVLREWNLLSHVCAIAIKEWKWLKLNPFKDVKRPKAPEARWRRITPDEINRLMIAMGYDYAPPKTVIARVGAAFLFSLETGLRAGELCALTWQHVHPRHIHLPITKNGFKRDVPLSAEARRILDELPKESEHVFDLANTQIDSLFRKAKARCLIDGLHWHDTRHEALTRLSKKLNVMELAKIAGIRDLRILQNVYYNPSIDDLADKL